MADGEMTDVGEIDIAMDDWNYTQDESMKKCSFTWTLEFDRRIPKIQNCPVGTIISSKSFELNGIKGRFLLYPAGDTVARQGQVVFYVENMNKFAPNVSFSIVVRRQQDMEWLRDFSVDGGEEKIVHCSRSAHGAALGELNDLLDVLERVPERAVGGEQDAEDTFKKIHLECKIAIRLSPPE